MEEGGSVTFTITPYDGYSLGQLLIDGANVSVTGSYTFSDVRQDHTIYAVFQVLPATEPPITDPPVTEPPAPTDAPAVIPEPDITDVPTAPEIPQEPDAPPVIE